MRNAIVLFTAFIILSIAAIGAEQPYAISNIPAHLLKDAGVVKRTELIRYEITERNKAKYIQKVAYTILNERGDRWASFAQGYDKLRSIESFEGSLYDASGKKIRSLKKSEIRDVSGNDDASLIDDNRLKWHSFFYKLYPFTVEYEVEVSFKGTMFSPDWIPQEKALMSVQEAKLIVVSPVINPLRFRSFNYKGDPLIAEDKSGKNYRWEVRDLPAFTEEYASPSWHELTTSVFLATEKFVLDDYDGSNTSWKDFGKFVYELKKDKDELPADIKAKVHQLTDGLKEPGEKVRKLYEYMQQNTRYISVQLGIGGWQPFDAKYVAAKKYGDCKALSNYMYSLLKEVGIRSVYTVIGAGDDNDYLLTELPSSQFNHVILFVPLERDTTWLECTSQSLPAGYLSAFTANRYALAVDESGGTLVRTPRYGLKENLQTRLISASIDGEGRLRAKVRTKYAAEQQDRLHNLVNGLSKDKLMEFLKENIELATYDISSFEYREERKSIPVLNENLDLVAENYATISGKRLFVMPNVLTRTNRKLQMDDNRKNDLVLDLEFRDIDTVVIEIPPGFSSESIPSNVQVRSKFGSYESSIDLKDNKLNYYRKYEHYRGRYPASDYGELAKFYETIYKADRCRVVLKKEETTKGF